MEVEGSLFETTEMVGNFLASTSLLLDSWRLCTLANSPGSSRTVTDQTGHIGLMGFSSLHDDHLGSASTSWANGLFPLLEASEHGLFSGFDTRGNGGGDEDDHDDEPVMVHAGILQLFLSLHASPSFQSQTTAVLEKSKSVILTGHSIGGAMASLTALWLLNLLQHNPNPPHVLCITFGSPLLGNVSFSKSILLQRWNRNFCHLVLKHDIVPRLLFAPIDSMDTQLHFLLQYIQFSGVPHLGQSTPQMSNEMKYQLFCFVAGYEAAAKETAGKRNVFWPFGNYLLCSEEGAICLDNGVSVVKLLHLMFHQMGDANLCFEDHLKYGRCVDRLSLQFLTRKGFTKGDVPVSSYEAGLSLAVHSAGLATQDSAAGLAKDCLKMVKHTGLTPNLNSARLAISLAKITPHRAQIEWYKSSCDESDDQMGYYDSFKRKQASRRETQVNMFRIKLGGFWDNLIRMIDNNELPHDFHRRRKFVNAAHFYQLLVEPLDIAEYYRRGEHLSRGHYLKYGRDRRHEIFDKWWRERHAAKEESRRSKFASLTQDSCFWARVEEARELLDRVRRERKKSNIAQLWQSIDVFERYAKGLIDSKKISVDVLAKNSSYSSWVEEVREVRSQVQSFQQFPGLMNGEVVP